MIVTNLRCNGLKNPIGISFDKIRFSWELLETQKNVIQTGACLQIWENEKHEGEPLIDLNVAGREQWITIKGNHKLHEKKSYFWKVTVCAKAGEVRLKGYNTGQFMTALADEKSWKAVWIEANDQFYDEAAIVCRKFWKKRDELGMFGAFLPADENGLPLVDQGLRRCPYFLKTFSLQNQVNKAYIYITARGFYELKINGKKVGACALAPDFTPYDKEIYYQTFDISDFLQIGENRMEIVLGDGWYCGHAQGIPGQNYLYGQRPALLAQAEITHADGSKTVIATDKSFECFSGKLMYADLFMGERLDLSQTGKAYGTVEREYDKKVLVPQEGEFVKVVQTLQAVSVKKMEDGSYLIDFGQVIAGREKLQLCGRAGETVKIERAEELLPDGHLYKIIPTFPYHDQTNYIVFSENKEISYCPSFTFQGFRYLQISGLSEKPEIKDCKAEVVSTAMANVNEFRSDNEKLNRLVENIKWSQRGNMLSVPTDCPQRERAGFTGDAQVFGKAASWNLDVRQFFCRWLKQCRLEQLPGGQVPIVVPYSDSYKSAEPNPGWTSAGWGDAIVFLPWQLYQIYDDISFLEENFEAMEKWMQYVKRCAEETMPEKYYMDFMNRGRQRYLWNTGFHWGDWLIPGLSAEEGVEKTKEIVASIFYYRAVRIMIKVCETLGREEREYVFLETRIREAFQTEYIREERLVDETQGNYVLALETGIVDGELEQKFALRLNDLVKENGYCLQTGFLSTPFLLDTLWNYGYQDTAWKVLYQESCPSWFYEVNHGATTIWEEWDAITESGEYKASSFNHYAFGSVCDFIYRKIGGITPLEKGFRKYQIAPQMHKQVGKCDFSYKCPYGTIHIIWEKTAEGIAYDLQLPANTTAVVFGIKDKKEVGSGCYKFVLE